MPGQRLTSAGQSIVTIILLMISVMAASSPAAATSINETRSTLARIERRIHQTSASLGQKKAAEEAMKRDLTTVEKEQAQISHRISEQRRQLDELEKKISLSEQHIQETRIVVGTLKQKVRQRLTAMYKRGTAGLFQILFSASSPARMAENYDYLERIVRRNHELLTDYHQKLSGLQRQSDALSVLRRNHKSTLSELHDERQTLSQATQLKTALLKSLHAERAKLSSQLKSLRERAGRLSVLLKKLESRQPREYTENSGIFSRQKGQLSWPVAGKVATGFGTGHHQELGTRYDSQGIEIETGEGTPIHAVWGGKVVFANWFKGYGNLVIINHGGSFYTLYAQAARLAAKVGDQVARGQIVGYSGYDGKKTVYFEIRHGGTPVDPTDWLSQR
ncbi:MAG TPA: peptidoglycan DD-metalloendopeptidase family protein [Desulfuromonadales bacterium]|nr:peptidoglycan DD-metalloendopeptidase family protein [Desulfuromonadales bacterium]